MTVKIHALIILYQRWYEKRRKGVNLSSRHSKSHAQFTKSDCKQNTQLFGKTRDPSNYSMLSNNLQANIQAKVKHSQYFQQTLEITFPWINKVARWDNIWEKKNYFHSKE